MFNRDTYEQGPLFLIPNFRTKHRTAMYIIDWTFILAAAVVGASLFITVPARQHLFRLDDPDISYPMYPSIVDYPLLISLTVVLPLLIIAGIAIFVMKSGHDLHHAALGLFQSLVVTLLVVSVIKIYLGGLRPHFLVACAPDPALILTAKRYGYNGTFFDTSICTGDTFTVNDAQSAFPSGHSALAAAGMTFICLYLNAKFKMFHHRGHMWIYILVTLSLFGAVLIGFSRIVDYHHTPYNVLMGLTMGTVIATSMFRLNYLSLFGKHNHVPVADHWYFPRQVPNGGHHPDRAEDDIAFNYSTPFTKDVENATYGTQGVSP